MWKQAIVCCAFATVAMAAMFIAPLQEKPEKYKDEAGCYVSELSTMLPIGVSGSSPEHCILYTCEEDSISVMTCPSVKASPECHLVSKDMPYPYCCPRCEELPSLTRAAPRDDYYQSASAYWETSTTRTT